MKKSHSELAHRLRELLEKVISKREKIAPLPKNHQISAVTIAYSRSVSLVSIYKMHLLEL